MFAKYLTFLILPLFGFSSCNSEDTNVIEICNDHLVNRRLLLVSTLDGQLSALDINNGGSLKWAIATDPGPLLSSTIHQLDITENSHAVRIIPSLSGGLYKFDGDFIEPIPVNVDSLLKSYSDEVDITGGKEIRSYAVEIETGKILYQCSMNECSNWTENTYLNYDMVLLRRETQIVRAIEPQTRIERWNYSVGLHNVSLTRGVLPECRINSEPMNVDVKVVVPKGILSLVNTSDPNEILWEHKFTSPVVNVWRLIGNRLENIDLFRSAENAPDEMRFQARPTLYIGLHDKQWYIQESEPFHRNHILHDKPLLTMKKWKLIHAVDSDSDRNIPQITDESGHNETTALTKLSDLEAINGNGYYLYCADKKGDCHTERRGFFIVSVFTNWWKEAAVLLLVTFCLINYLMPCPNLTSFSLSETVKLFLNRFRQPHITKESAMEATNSKQDSGIGGVYCSTSSEFETSSYKSRYLDDFVPIHCLGKGGFGVVFQAKNKIDDCDYAIKRITLPNKEEARERVMREVKALAKLEHQHIVRYFQAWQECPPVGWQEEQDKLWKYKSKDEYLSSELDGPSSSTTSQTHLNHIYSKSTNVCDVNLPNVNSIVPNSTSESNNSVVEFQHSHSDNSETPLKLDYDSSSPDSSTKQSKPVTRRKSFNKTSKVYLYIQMQLCQKNSLKEWLCDNLSRDSNTILSIFDQTVQAVEYVHLQGLIHRDLKPSNIFFSPDGQIKVGDFGLVTEMIEDTDVTFDNATKSFFDESRTANVGTELYMSPEQVKGKPYNHKVDIYSLGIIFFELLMPFSTQMERHRTLIALRNNIYPKDFQVNHKHEYNLLSMMLADAPEKRPTTIGIRARAPLSNFRAFEGSNLQDWHFELPTKNSCTNTSILRKSSAETA